MMSKDWEKSEVNGVEYYSNVWYDRMRRSSYSLKRELNSVGRYCFDVKFY